MAKHGLRLFVIPMADPHGSEYIAPRYELLRHVSGFTGSAGLLLVAQEAAALWTDSRYFLQAEAQLAGTGIELMREGCEGTPAPAQWVEGCVAGSFGKEEGGMAVGFPPDMTTHALLASCGISTTGDSSSKGFVADTEASEEIIKEIWRDRPAAPAAPVTAQPQEWVGRSTREKLETLGTHLPKGLEVLVLNDLSDIAWLFNLRGADIEFNPVFQAYAVMEFDTSGEGGAPKATLCTDLSRLMPEARALLESEGVALAGYESLPGVLERMGTEKVRVALPETLSWEMESLIHERCGHHDLGHAPSPVEPIRAVKNAAEQAGFREAMRRDGVAMVQFLRRLDERMAAGEAIDEVEVDRLLTECRAAQPGFAGLSFATIAGYGAHGAIVHYEATPETAATLRPEGLLLLDSGAQYDCGTTDITRTIALGALTEEERRVYTLVLKGHIALSRARFPQGTTGLQLDYAARAAMWREGYDFGHGTGHGVGSHLCVHEGPHQIRKNADRACTLVPLKEGMTVTNEPGIYVPGKFGVRTENVLLVVPAGETAFGKFSRFETLTLCPYDLRAVEPELLDREEKEWLNGYHRTVREALLPLLDDEKDKEWLKSATENF